MKRIITLCIVAVSAVFMLWTSPALADGDAANGAKLFQANCAACHAGGNNLVNPAKTLKKDVLEANGMFSLDAIKTQVTNGKGAMPAFGAKLDAQQVEDVATYVLTTAEAGW